MVLRIAVVGATGRMGRTLGRLIREAEQFQTLGGIAPEEPGADSSDYPEIVPIDRAGQLVRQADAVIDFSAPAYLDRFLDHCHDALSDGALLVGTTGLDDEIRTRLRALTDSAAVLVAPNFSIGVNLLLGLVEEAARALPVARYDIEIVETHHRRKEDAPSGTALALGEAAAGARGEPLDARRRDGRSGTGARPEGEIGIHALRGGDIIGEHAVHLVGERERLVLGHTALSRDLFAEGALEAARWLVERPPGWYEMKDLLGR
jgi:4-hydroxy-tetrahydrodipicolinate reductase